MNIKLGYLGYISAGNATMLLFFLIGLGLSLLLPVCMSLTIGIETQAGSLLLASSLGLLD